MSTDGQTVDATSYLIIRGTRARYGTRDPETGLKSIEAAQIAAVRQNRPAKLERDEVLIKVRVRLPASVFDPITPQALIVVPEAMVLDRGEIAAEATEEE